MRRTAAFLGALTTLLFVALAAPAQAHHLAAGSDGNYVWCAVRVSNATLGASYDWWMSCTSASPTRFATAVEGFAHAGVRVWFDSAAWDGSDRRDSAVNATATVDTLSGGQLRSHGSRTWPTVCVADNDPPACRSALSPVADDSPSSDNIDTIELKKADGSGVTFPASQYDADHKAKIDAITVGGSGHPGYPPQGGTPPTTAQDGSCAVLTEQAGEGVYRARLRATVDDPDASDVLTVDHGDGSDPTSWTSGVAYWHYFPAPDPGATYTITYTVERDGQDDETCAVDVNFFDGTLDTGTFGTGSPDSGEDEDDEGASSCGFFDVVCWLKKLFVPDTDELGTAWSDLTSSAGGNWPFGPMVWVSDTMTDVSDDVAAGDLPPGVFVGSEGSTIRAEIPLGDVDVTLPLLSEHSGGPCAPESQDPGCQNEPIRQIVWLASTLLIALALVYALLSLARRIMGKDGDDA